MRTRRQTLHRIAHLVTGRHGAKFLFPLDFGARVVWRKAVHGDGPLLCKRRKRNKSCAQDRENKKTLHETLLETRGPIITAVERDLGKLFFSEAEYFLGIHNKACDSLFSRCASLLA